MSRHDGAIAARPAASLYPGASAAPGVQERRGQARACPGESARRTSKILKAQDHYNRGLYGSRGLSLVINLSGVALPPGFLRKPSWRAPVGRVSPVTQDSFRCQILWAAPSISTRGPNLPRQEPRWPSR